MKQVNESLSRGWRPSYPWQSLKYNWPIPWAPVSRQHGHLLWVLDGYPLQAVASGKTLSPWSYKYCFRDFPGGPVVKNPPANAGDKGSIPSLGRSYMPRGNKTNVPQFLKPLCLEPVLRNKKSHCIGKPTNCNEEWPPLTTIRESSRAAGNTSSELVNVLKEKSLWREFW